MNTIKLGFGSFVYMFFDGWGGEDDLDPQIKAELEYYRSEIGQWETAGRLIEERLKTSYLSNPGIAEPSYRFLTEANEYLQSGHFSAAVVFAVAAVEALVRLAIIEPLILSSILHDEFAQAIARNILDNRPFDKLSSIFLFISRDVGLDITSYKPEGWEKNPWEAFVKSQKIRNRVLHGGSVASPEEASLALRASEHVLNTVFSSILFELGLHPHSGLVICGTRQCSDPIAWPSGFDATAVWCPRCSRLVRKVMKECRTCGQPLQTE